MSHHYSGSDQGFPQGDARLDIAEVYAFLQPGDAVKSILIRNAHLSAGIDPPASTMSAPFAAEALHERTRDGETAQPLLETVSHPNPYSLAASGNIDRKYNLITSEPARGPQHA